MLIKESFAKRLTKEKCEPAQCTTGSALKEKTRRQYITGMAFVMQIFNWSRVVETIYVFFFRGGDIYKGEVSGLQGGPNAISR